MDTGVLYCDDNLARLADLEPESVDLIYLDPPFFSNRFYEVIWGDEAEVRSFEDRWEGGIQYYIDWMHKRVQEMHRVLKRTGALYLHCDPHASHHLKLMLDEVFTPSMFRNELIWKRTSAHSSARRYGPIHDVIFFFTKSDKYTWNPTFTEYDEHYVSQFYTHVDPDGRRWRRSDLTGSGIRHGETGQVWRGRDVTAKGRHWAYRPSELERMDAAGKIHWPKKAGGMPMLKRYFDEQKGVPAQDVWTDIPPLHNLAAERLGYPTQKPEALLERIITASSNPGDVVLDPFCGCGTTVAVAERLQREWVGIDISLTAIDIMERRLLKQGRVPIIENAPNTPEALKRLKPFEFQNWAIGAINGTHSPRRTGDMGIDGFWFFTRDPVQVKQSERVGRNVVDNFETAIRRAGNDTGYIIAFSFTRGAHEEVARVRKDEGLTIHLVKAEEVLLLRHRRFGQADIPGPVPGNVDELPVPSMRKPEDLPTPEELIKSDQAATA